MVRGGITEQAGFDGLVSIDEAAELIGVEADTVRKWAKRDGVLQAAPERENTRGQQPLRYVPEAWVSLVSQQSPSARDAKLLKAIADYRDQHGISPSVRDLQRAMGVSSCSVIAYRLKRLVRLGLLRMEPLKSRTTHIVQLSDQPVVN